MPPARRTAAKTPAGDPGPQHSAVQTLVDILAEYVAPIGAVVWQETLVAAMGQLGYTPAAIRQAISRSAREGALSTARHGNRALVELDEDARRMLISGAQRLGIDPDATAEIWDGQWQVFIVQSRGKDHRDSYRLRTSMLLGGLGYLGNGIWISPSGQLKDEIVAALASEPGVTLTVLSSRVEYPETADLAQRAWALEDLAEMYREAHARFVDRTAEEPEECFNAWTELVQAWAQCVRADPGLPEEAVGPGWPREPLRRLVAERAGRWRSTAREYFGSLGPGRPEEQPRE